MTVSQGYKEIAQQKLAERDAKFFPEWLVPEDDLPSTDLMDVTGWLADTKYLLDLEKEITTSDAPTIVSNIRNRKWTCLEVTKAFCHRSSIAHQLVNCLTEIFYDEAIARAEELDKFQEETGTTLGPFHGLPISLKDNFNVKGHASTVGIVKYSFEKMTEDAVLVGLLREQGAIFYVKTNVPVAMMMPESTNHIWGTTVNPLNRNLSAGGSSGGEAALLALHGLPLGLGTDIGGSIRIPASFQNLFALKPTLGRFPTYGCRAGLPGLELVSSINGPMTTSLTTLDYYCKNILTLEPWYHDPNSVALPWRTVDVPGKLNIAILEDDLVVRPTPPIRRGLKIVRDALTEAGHTVIDWVPEDHLRLSQIITAFFLSDGGDHVLKETRATGEALFPYMKMYGQCKDLPTLELRALHVERTALAKKFLDRWRATKNVTGNGRPIDVIIAPTTPFPGSVVGKFGNHVGYTSPFNALNFSVGILPVTRAHQDLDPADAEPAGHNEGDIQTWADYNSTESHGGAVALQVVGQKFEEEKVVEIMKVISELIDKKQT